MKHRKQRSDKGKPRGSYKEKLSVAEPLKEEMENNLVETPQSNKKELSYEDLPLSIRNNIEGVIKYRLNLGLSDDSTDRKRKALDYYKHQLSLKERQNEKTNL